MHTARNHTVMTLNSEQIQHLSRKYAIDGYMRPERAPQVFHSTSRPHCMIPGHQQIGRDLAGRVTTLQQVEAL